jgi:hypothetical protein
LRDPIDCGRRQVPCPIVTRKNINSIWNHTENCFLGVAVHTPLLSLSLKGRNGCTDDRTIPQRARYAAYRDHCPPAFEIVRILVVGIETSGGILPVRPTVHFSLFGVKEYAV